MMRREKEKLVPDAMTVYCWIHSFEIQVVPGYQRKGIGAYLIRLLEAIGKQTSMDKVMLTVFKGMSSSFISLARRFVPPKDALVT